MSVQVADQRITELQGQVEDKDREKENVEESLHGLRKQVKTDHLCWLEPFWWFWNEELYVYVRFLSLLCRQLETREEEIARLSRMLKGGRPPEALAAEMAQESNERMLAHLNIQVRARFY